MFKRIIYDNWADWVPYVAFAVTAVIFLAFVGRALAVRREHADAMSRLPLDD